MRLHILSCPETAVLDKVTVINLAIRLSFDNVVGNSTKNLIISLKKCSFKILFKLFSWYVIIIWLSARFGQKYGDLKGNCSSTKSELFYKLILKH